MGAVTKFLEFAVERGVLEKMDQAGIESLAQRLATHVADADIVGLAKGGDTAFLDVLKKVAAAGVNDSKLSGLLTMAANNPDQFRLLQRGLMTSPQGQAFVTSVTGATGDAVSKAMADAERLRAQGHNVGDQTMAQLLARNSPTPVTGGPNWLQTILNYVPGVTGWIAGHPKITTVGAVAVGATGLYAAEVLPSIHGTQQVSINANQISSTEAQAREAQARANAANYNILRGVNVQDPTVKGEIADAQARERAQSGAPSVTTGETQQIDQIRIQRARAAATPGALPNVP